MPTPAGRGRRNGPHKICHAHVNEKDLFMFLKVAINTVQNGNGREFVAAFWGSILLFMMCFFLSKGVAFN